MPAGSLLVISVALVFLSTGITPSAVAGGPPHPLQAELDHQRAVWQSAGLADYSYQMQRSCFCLPEGTTPGLVVVRDQAIDRVEDDFGFPLDPELYLTIDELFDVVQSAINANAESIVVSYDSKRGFPAGIQIDHLLIVADDEISYTADAFMAGTGFELIQAELDAARSLFQSAGIDDYDYVMQRGCFCSREFTAPGRVMVRKGLLIGVEAPASGDALDPDLYRTLEQLFDVIQDAIDSEADSISVLYDSGLGFPESIAVDYVLVIADEEIFFSATEFVPEPIRLALQLTALGVVAMLTRARRVRSRLRESE